jgi:dihydrolipoamide dehydrogenase
MESYDVTVIGSGPGGYVAAIRCAQLGMKTAIVEKYPSLGGTCLNVGCIPSKALLDSSEHFFNATHSFKTHGIDVPGIKVNIGQMMSRKELVVKQNTDGVKFLMKKNKIDVFTGSASFLNAGAISIEGEKKTEISSKKFIIATGSKPSQLKGITTDKKRIITSTEALTLKEIPRHLIVIGGGVIGLELGSVYARLGAMVSIVEFTEAIIGTMDRALGKELQKVLQKEGFEFYLRHKVTSAKVSEKSVSVTAEGPDGKSVSFEGDYCLVSTGRSPYTEGLALDKAGIKTDERGRIPVDDSLQTSVKNIYAIGDVIRGAMLAHKAEDEGVYVAEIMAGQKPHINYLLIPGVVYTWPEVASVGYTEEELKSAKTDYIAGTFPFKASGRARASMDTDGFIKVLTDRKTDEILGVHMIGPRAADMIAEAVVAMEFRASAEDIARMSHAHPTYTEAFREACLAATGNRAIHI